MVYSFHSRVRYSEVGEDRKLTLNSILNYFQDCSTFQSEAVGLGLEKLAKNQQVWLMISWQICVNRYPKLGEYITIKTWAYGFKGFYGYRNFLMEDEQGNPVAYANAIWCFMDLKANRPVTIPEEELKGYEVEEKLDMKYAPRKIKVPQECEEREAFVVMKHHLDTNHHVNNGQYIQMAVEYLPDDFVIKQMRAEYKVQALLGDTVIPYVHNEDGKYTITLCNTQGKPYVIVEFI